MSLTGKRHAPACCADNAMLGFVLASETTLDGETVRGVTFQISITDAVGVTHVRHVKACPLCGRPLWQIRCAEIDAWVPDKSIEAALSSLHEKLDEESR